MTETPKYNDGLFSFFPDDPNDFRPRQYAIKDSIPKWQLTEVDKSYALEDKIAHLARMCVRRWNFSEGGIYKRDYKPEMIVRVYDDDEMDQLIVVASIHEEGQVNPEDVK